MSFILDGLKSLAGSAGTVIADTGFKGKLRADMLLIDRDMRARKAKFGVELYDFVAPLAARPDFFAANDRMTETIRGPFLAAQREIAALAIKRTKIKEKAAQAEIVKKSAFPTPAETIAGQVLNAGKAVGYAGKDAAIATELSMCDSRIKNEKQEFGIAFFDVLVQLEDSEGWLPTVRDIRTMYDQVRRDLEKLEAAKVEKQKEILAVGGSNDDMPPTSVQPKAPIVPLPHQNGTPRVTDPFANEGPIDPWANASSSSNRSSNVPVQTVAAPVSAPCPLAPQMSVEKLAMSAAGRVTPGVAGFVMSAAARAPAAPSTGLFSYPTDNGSTSNNIGYGSSGYAPPRVAAPVLPAHTQSAFADPFAVATTAISATPFATPSYDPFAAPATHMQYTPAWDPFAGSAPANAPPAAQPPSSVEYDPFAGL
ncbi:hypothetical protein MPSEU_000316300 [Mayamaea pseudoterrestris]|nr:hypothetical protein MPSEU_000316300 [Mayamaea pseudoterrestris]